MSRGFRSRDASVRFTMETTAMVLVSRNPRDDPSDASLTVAQPDDQLQFSFDICDGDVHFRHANLHTRIDGHERRDLCLQVDLCLEVVYDQSKFQSAKGRRKNVKLRKNCVLDFLDREVGNFQKHIWRPLCTGASSRCSGAGAATSTSGGIRRSASSGTGRGRRTGRHSGGGLYRACLCGGFRCRGSSLCRRQREDGAQGEEQEIVGPHIVPVDGNAPTLPNLICP